MDTHAQVLQVQKQRHMGIAQVSTPCSAYHPAVTPMSFCNALSKQGHDFAKDWFCVI